MYLNQGGKTFIDITFSAWFPYLQKGHGIAVSELDNYGDQEIYTEMPPFERDVFHNALFINLSQKHNWIMLNFQGKKIQSYRIRKSSRTYCIRIRKGAENLSES